MYSNDLKTILDDVPALKEDYATDHISAVEAIGTKLDTIDTTLATITTAINALTTVLTPVSGDDDLPEG